MGAERACGSGGCEEARRARALALSLSRRDDVEATLERLLRGRDCDCEGRGAAVRGENGRGEGGGEKRGELGR